MRKIIVSEMISVDGYFAGEDGNINWHTVDEDFNKMAIDFEKTIDTIIFGRKTYQMFEQYWPMALKDSNVVNDDKEIAKFIDEAKKVVFSRSLEKVTWNNSVLFKDNIENEVKKLKEEESEKNIVVYGSGSIVKELTKLGLVDEFLLIVSPTILGKGISMFKDVGEIKLKLHEARPFKNGNVVLRYGV